MHLNDLTNSKLLLKKYSKSLKEKYDFDLNAFIIKNGLNNSHVIISEQLNILRENSSFEKEYAKNVIILSAIKIYEENL